MIKNIDDMKSNQTIPHDGRLPELNKILAIATKSSCSYDDKIAEINRLFRQP